MKLRPRTINVGGNQGRGDPAATVRDPSEWPKDQRDELLELDAIERAIDYCDDCGAAPCRCVLDEDRAALALDDTTPHYVNVDGIGRMWRHRCRAGVARSLTLTLDTSSCGQCGAQRPNPFDGLDDDRTPESLERMRATFRERQRRAHPLRGWWLEFDCGGAPLIWTGVARDETHAEERAREELGRDHPELTPAARLTVCLERDNSPPSWHAGAGDAE